MKPFLHANDDDDDEKICCIYTEKNAADDKMEMCIKV